MKNLRNARIVGKNSASYDAKHPENPVVYHEVRAAKKRAIKLDFYGKRIVPDYKKLNVIRHAANLSKPQISATLRSL